MMDSDDLDADSLAFLMERYNQLIEQQISTNEIIHNTFYISIVVFGALVGILPQLASLIMRAIIAIFSAGIFFAMLLWTRTYLNSRQEIERHLARVLNEIETTDFDLDGIDSVDAFFSAPADFRQDRWEQNWTKEQLLLIYYFGLALVSLSLPVAEAIVLSLLS